jgi:hypothetical protein
MALRAKIVSGEAAGFGSLNVKGENQAWRNFRRNLKGRANFSHLLVAPRWQTPGMRRSSLLDLRAP